MNGLKVHMAVDDQEAHSSAMHEFLRFCERQTLKTFLDYASLQAWAVSEYLQFWQLFAQWTRLPFSGSVEPVVDVVDCERARFFPELRVNYSRCLLRDLGVRSDDRPAVVGTAEGGRRTSLTRRQLREATERCAAGLTRLGVRGGDRVVAVASNTPEAIVACLATVAIGAIWSSVAPDMGEFATLERFRQLDPVVLFANTQYVFGGSMHSLHDRISNLGKALPALRLVVALDQGALPELQPHGITFLSLEQLKSHGSLSIDDWDDFPFNHPAFVLFSSGTTGAPKGLIHGAGGTLIEHYKELVLHSSLGLGEKLYFHTSTGWMMWNWQLSALACGTEIVLYDGSPTFPKFDALIKMIDREEVTVFGTSATYLHALQLADLSPRNRVELKHLHTIQSTGSILYDAQYDWIANHFRRVKVQSVSGGTDIAGLFVLGNPLLPIYRGESQCIGLGFDVRVMTDEGLKRFGVGELVCVNAFPSRPVGIFGDVDSGKLHDTYFAQNPGMWTHGDHARLSESGCARILGRSDGTINVRGVRIGPAEIYSIVLSIPGILNVLAVEQRAPQEPGGSRLVLLIVLQEGMSLTSTLVGHIKKELRQKASRSHVPSVIAQVVSIPVTHSGKFSEKYVRDLLNGKPPCNHGSLMNPESLNAIAMHPLLQPQAE